MSRQSRDEFNALIDAHSEAGTCYLCNLPVEEFTPVHGLTHSHWDCHEKLHGATKKEQTLSEAINVSLRSLEPQWKHQADFLARAKGGFLIHTVDGKTGRALCGHTLKNTAKMMVTRSGWVRMTHVPEHRHRCTKCDAKITII